MSEVFTIDTTDNIIRQTSPQTPGSTDPYNHLPPKEWVEKQVEWGEKNVSGRGLVPILNTLEGDLIGCEIGVCLGVTTQKFAQEVKNLKTLYAVDSYPSYIDWNGTVISQERQDEMKAHAVNRLAPYKDKIQFVYKTSQEFAPELKEGDLDFIFIDGDHSEEGALRDLQTYYPFVKTGGVFAGHDLNVPTVNKAIRRFLNNDMSKVVEVEDNAWYILK